MNTLWPIMDIAEQLFVKAVSTRSACVPTSLTLWAHDDLPPSLPLYTKEPHPFGIRPKSWPGSRHAEPTRLKLRYWKPRRDRIDEAWRVRATFFQARLHTRISVQPATTIDMSI